MTPNREWMREAAQREGLIPTPKAEHTPEPWREIMEGLNSITDNCAEWSASQTRACAQSLLVDVDNLRRSFAGMDPAAIPALIEAAERALAEFDKCTMFDANGDRFDDLRAALAALRGTK